MSNPNMNAVIANAPHENGGDKASAQAANAEIVITKPGAGETYEVAIEPGQKYAYSFTNADVQSFAQEGNDLTIYFTNHSSIVLKDYVSATDGDTNGDDSAKVSFIDAALDADAAAAQAVQAAQPPSEQQLADPQSAEAVQQPQPADTEQVINKAMEAGEETDLAAADNVNRLAQIEPAAGDAGGGGAAGGHGYGFQSSFVPQGVIPISDVGPINPTELQYGVEFQNDEILLGTTPAAAPPGISALGPTENLDETNLAGGPLVETGQIVVDFGNDTPGTIDGNNVFSASGSLAGGVLTSHGVAINVVFDAATNTYTGTAGGATVFTLHINEATGAYEYTQLLPFDHADGSNPNDIITLNFGIIATDADGDSVTTSVTVNVADDAPISTPSSQNVDETNLGPVTVNGSLTINYGADLPGHVAGNSAFSATGSVAGGTLSSHGHPVTVAYNAGTGTYTGTANGATVFTLHINADGTYSFTLIGTLDHADATNPNDIINLNFGVVLTDFDGDSATTNIVIHVADDGPSISGATGSADETDLNMGPVVVNGSVTHDFGHDGAGAVSGNNTFTSGGSELGGNLTSHGVPVNVTYNAGTGTYTGTAGGNTVFTLHINADGTYTFTLLGGLDHADPNNPNDIIDLNFGVRVSDGDQDTASATITIHVADSVPTIPGNNEPQIGHGLENVDETNLGPVIVNGSLPVNFGGDAPGHVNGNNTFTFGGSALGGNLTSHGVAVNVTYNAVTGTYTGAAGGNTVFTLHVNADGTYSFTLNGVLDHADGTNPNDVIVLHFGVTATDADGDAATGSITVNVADDAPSITGSMGSVDETDLGPVVLNGTLAHDFGHDGAGSVSGTGTFTSGGSELGGNLTSHGVPVNVTYNAATGIYTGAAGGTTVFTLHINADGTYAFTLLGGLDHADPNNPNDIIDLNFGAHIVDFDGDSANTTITIHVLDDAPSIPGNNNPTIGHGLENVDETNLGPITVNGTLPVDIGGDAPGHVGGNGVFSATGSELGGNLTSHGVAVNVTFNAGTGIYTGAAGGNTVFTLHVNADGSYSFTLLGVLDHADGSNPNDVINLHFGVSVTDFDGDTATGSITVNVADDGPSIGAPPVLSVDETDLGPVTVGGTVAANFGHDGPGNVSGNNVFSATGSVLGGTLTSHGIPVNVTFNAGTGTYTGTAGGNTIFTMHINADGTYSFTLIGELDHADPNDPNDIITLHFGAQVTDFDGDTATTSIAINVLDDGPVIDDQPTIGNGLENVDETNLGPITVGGTLPVNFGDDTPGHVNGNGAFASSGSQAGGVLTSHGVAVNVTYNAVTGTYTGAAGGNTVFTLHVNADGTYSFTLIGTLDHANTANPNDIITLNFGVTATDVDGDTATGTILVNVFDDGPVLGDLVLQSVDESNLGPITIGGALAVNFGHDGGGHVDGTGVFSATGSIAGGTLTSHGTQVMVTYNAATNTYTGAAGGSTVFTLHINADGTYSFTLVGTLDHADPNNPNDIITLNFGATAFDYDGDNDPATIRINVLDSAPSLPGNDNPTIGHGLENVDETNLGPITVGGTLPVNFGGDAPGHVGGNGAYSATGSVLGGSLTSHGIPVNVVFNAGTNTYTGTSGGNTIFTMHINADGSYSFTLVGHLDHANAANPNDVIELHFGVTATDGDGDTANGSITVNVADDGPTAVNDFNSWDGGKNLVVGNVLTNDHVGADAPGSVHSVSFNGNVVNIAPGQTVTINGLHGALTISSNGTYLYTPFPDVDSDGTDVFGYGMHDYDGDPSSATLSITIDHDDVPVVTNEVLTVDETNIGPVIVNGQLDATFGHDAPGSFSGNGSHSAAPLTAHGVPVVISYNAATGTYTGMAGINTIFTLHINTNGTYNFSLYGTLDHPDPNNPNDTINLHFGFNATDSDGDITTGDILVHVNDDGPSLVSDAAHGVNEADMHGGPVVVNGQLDTSFGHDGPGSIHPNGTSMVLFQVGGVNQTLYSHGVPVVITQTANGYTATAGGTTVFTLTLNPLNGQYTYTQFTGVDHPGAGQTGTNDTIWIKLGVEITDYDGDHASSFIQIDLRDDGPVATNDVRLVNANVVTGNVTGNDSYGTDGPGFLHSVTFGGVVHNIAQGQTITINGHYGVLQISSNGSYTYTSSHTGDGSDVFTYGIHDFDGDNASATLTLNVDNPLTVTVSVNNGVDDVIVKEDHTVQVNAQAHVVGGDANDVLTLTLTGVNPAWGAITFPNLGFSPAGSVVWVPTGNPGEYRVTLPAGIFNYNANFIFTPQHNSDIDLSGMHLTASVYDPDTGSTTTSQDSFNVVVDAVIDAPTLVLQDVAGGFAVSWDVHQPHTVPLSIFAQVGDTDGSEQITKIIINLNNQFTNGAPGLNSLEDMGVGLNMGVEVSPGIWEIQVHNGNTTAALQGLALVVPASDNWLPIMQHIIHAGHDVNITVTAVAQEVNLHGTEVDFTDNQTTVIGNIALEFWLTPLVLDLNGDGIDIVNQDAGVMFDMNNNGTLDHTAWVGAHDGFLAIDINHDGVINNQSELFGSTAEHADGFANLASYDSNGDGRIDASDAAFNDLLVWQDLNQDGVSQQNEMFSLSALNIVAINLNATATGHYVGDAWISAESTFEYGDGHVNVIGDAWFHADDGNNVGATLQGTDGRDIVYGTTKNDIIIGGGGNDTLYGRGGNDVFVFAANGGVDTIKDFNAGDRIDVSALLQGFDAAHSDIHNYVFTSIVNGNTVISIDVTGSGDAGHATVIGILEGVTGMSVEDITGYHAPTVSEAYAITLGVAAAPGDTIALPVDPINHEYGHLGVHEVGQIVTDLVSAPPVDIIWQPPVHDGQVDNGLVSAPPVDIIWQPPVHDGPIFTTTTIGWEGSGDHGHPLPPVDGDETTAQKGDEPIWYPIDTTLPLHGGPIMPDTPVVLVEPKEADVGATSEAYAITANFYHFGDYPIWQSPPIINLPPIDRVEDTDKPIHHLGGVWYPPELPVVTPAADELQKAIDAFVSKPQGQETPIGVHNVDGHAIWGTACELPVFHVPSQDELHKTDHSSLV